MKIKSICYIHQLWLRSSIHCLRFVKTVNLIRSPTWLSNLAGHGHSLHPLRGCTLSKNLFKHKHETKIQIIHPSSSTKPIVKWDLECSKGIQRYLKWYSESNSNITGIYHQDWNCLLGHSRIRFVYKQRVLVRFDGLKSEWVFNKEIFTSLFKKENWKKNWHHWLYQEQMMMSNTWKTLEELFNLMNVFISICSH